LHGEIALRAGGIETPRLADEGSEVVTFCHGLKLPAPDGRMRETDCADTEGMFRIIQSIPSPKAEPFKRWLAIKSLPARERGLKHTERPEHQERTAELAKHIH